jgi:hypothetical protein
MKNVLATMLLLGAASLSGPSLPAHAQDSDLTRVTDTETVWVRSKSQEELLVQLNKAHDEMAAKGFRFVAMTPYSEKGILVGMFVTYARP